MHVFDLREERRFDPKKHVEKNVGSGAGGDWTVACWEPGQMQAAWRVWVDLPTSLIAFP
jgi:hypothetical protein